MYISLGSLNVAGPRAKGKLEILKCNKRKKEKE